MTNVCVRNAKMTGSVPHHAGHYIGKKPCSGHNVSGAVNNPGQSKLWIQGKEVFIKTGSGWSDDACDKSDFRPIEASSSMFVQGIPVVLVGHSVTLAPGSGKMITANQSKFYVRR